LQDEYPPVIDEDHGAEIESDAPPWRSEQPIALVFQDGHPARYDPTLDMQRRRKRAIRDLSNSQHDA